MKIIIDEENTQLKGSQIELLTGLGCLIDALRESGIRDENIKRAIDFAFLSDEEQEEHLKKQKKELSKNLKKAIDKILKELQEGV